MRAPNGVTLTAVRTPQGSIYKIVERKSEVDVHHESKARLRSCFCYYWRQGFYDHSTDRPEEPPTTKTLAEWHVDLGHIYAGAMIALAKNPLWGIRIKGSKTGFFCDSCVKAGMARKFSITPMPRSLRTMERVRIDLAGGGRTLDEMSDYPVESRQGRK
ncbi:hypothetical protein ACJ73_09289 [Blastomyces percursus]|uniref:GAG-pre-integrase domain-containing protein n=1 Tax=Blastomyces percursus TaxID=1658174 RepID=A0A1J9Q9J9_9EURO|nr:hypothetical protein ACJ73_09289 [Blastomyces percursus]